MMRALTILLLLLSCARVEAQSTLGDPITLDGVEVRGLRLRRDERPLPRVQSRGALRISLVSGRRGRHGGTHGVVSVCGRDAVRIETHTSAEPSVRVQIRPDVPSAHLVTPDRPAMTYVRVELTRNVSGVERIVTVEWAVPTERRESMRALEEAFFASIQCTSEG